jgi:predicted permease
MTDSLIESTGLAWYIIVFAITLPCILVIGGIIGGIAYLINK